MAPEGSVFDLNPIGEVGDAAEQEHMQIGSGQTNAAGERDRAAVNEVRAEAVDEIWKSRRTTDAGKRNNLFVLEIAFLQKLIKRGQHCEIAATGTPRWVISGDRLFC